jgi:type VI secretion system secreted protein Hcp
MTFQGDGCPPVEPSRRQRVRRKAVLIAVPTGVALGAGAMIANAAIPAADGTIGACYIPGGTVRFVDSAADCRKGDGTPDEQFLRFSQTGPPGPTGATGAAGAPGPAGAPGAPGGTGSPPPAPQAAASDYLLEIDGIKGESSDKKHKDTIELESFSWGVSQTGLHSSGGGGGAGKASFQDLHFTTPVNKSSPLLFKRCATGEHIKKAVLYVRKAGGNQEDYLTIKLSDVLVSSYQTKPSDGSDAVPTDEVSLNFAKIEFDYRPQLSNGALGAPLHGGWDLKANKTA